MILKSIKLDNIRSYVSQNIEFPPGSVMLSGDIGTGKSTILLAAEFALFGIRSDLRGESLLRHGKDTGSVELAFNIRGKNVVVKRALKRSNKSVQQDAGYLILDGVKKDLTAVELKARILDLLGYPKELVSKSKSLVYRYTVYTPQEQMKEILFDDKEERLNTLRRVFGIDKYQRVIENTSVITRQIKLRAKELAGSIHDLEEKKQRAAQDKSDLVKKEDESRQITPLLERARQSIQLKKEIIDRCEKDLKELNELKSRLNVSEAKLKEKTLLFQNNSKRISEIDVQIQSIQSLQNTEQKDIQKPDESLKKNLKEKKEAIEKEISQIKLAINELELTRRNSVSVKDKISSLSSCPTCLQNVPDDYKNQIIQKEDGSIQKCSQGIDLYNKTLQEKQASLVQVSKDIEQLLEQEKNCERFRIQAESNIRLLKEKNDSKRIISENQDQIKKDIAAINTKKIEITSKMSSLSQSEQNYAVERKAFDELKEKEKQLELRKLSFEKEAEGIRKMISALKTEIEEKQKAKDKIIKLKGTQEWLEKNFVNLMSVIEKHVMTKVYREFNELFQQWFKILIEDESLGVSLDHDFTPVVQQDGYETSVEHLSGGEKTAIALAYRLSLNKVINDIIGTIMTKDIIILDEPTDGFSSEQLDNVREVIEQLDMGQIILVSHEPKVEGFVDNILKIEKRGHVSSIS